MKLVLEQQGSCRAERAAVGWRGQAGAAGKLRGSGRRRVLQRGCRGEGVLWCVQCTVGVRFRL